MSFIDKSSVFNKTPLAVCKAIGSRAAKVIFASVEFNKTPPKRRLFKPPLDAIKKLKAISSGNNSDITELAILKPVAFLPLAMLS